MKAVKSLLIISMIMVMTLFSAEMAGAQTMYPVKRSVRNTFPHFSISPYGGAIFPLKNELSSSFKPGAMVNLDLGYRVNREVGFYGKFGYYFMSSKLTGAPFGRYIEVSAGPRFYVTDPKLKSYLFAEGGVGAYNFRQNSYANPNDVNRSVVNEISNTRAGLNGGLGASLALSDAIDIMIKSKYHVVFTPNGTADFVTVGAGFEFMFK